MPRRWLRAGGTTALRASGPTAAITMRRSCSTRTATTSRPSTTGRATGARASSALRPAGAKRVQAILDEPVERGLIPRVHEICVPRVLAHRRDLYPTTPGHGIADVQDELRHRDSVCCRADAVRRVRHVALVIRAVEPRAVP